jgi:predicted TIM-barrel fold metal-dependent hydrolase
MRTIAIEEHFLAQVYRGAMQSTPTLTPERQVKLVDLAALRLQDMDRGGIDLQVLSNVGSVLTSGGGDAPAELRLTREANEQLAVAIATHPDRFAGFAILPMAQPEAAAAELERAVRSLGLQGAMIHGTTNGRFLDDPAFLPVLERAAELAVPLYLHPAPPPATVRAAYYSNLDPTVAFVLATSGWGWHAETGLHALRLILAGVFDRLPTLQIILGHMGEMLPFMLARSNDTLTPMATYLQQPVAEYFLHHFYITTSGFFSDPPLLLALQVVGADRILFSVDYPFSSNERGRIFLDHAAISPADKEKISHLNAERLLRLASA